MKILFVMMVIVLGGDAAQAAPSFWKVESEKRIYFAAEPLVKVQRAELHGDDDYWDRILVTLTYGGEEVGSQGAQLRRANPGWEVQRVPVQLSGALILSIPSLGVSEEIKVLPSIDGPYFNATYFVKKKDSKAVKAAFANLPGFLSIEASVSASVPSEVLVERAELPASICGELRKNGSDLYSAMLGYPAVEKLIEAAAKREENRAALKKMVLGSCLELADRPRVRNFADLLALPLKELQPQTAFVAEHRMMGREDRQIPFSYQTVVEE